MQSDKTTASFSKTSLKIIGTPIFVLNYVESIMNQEPCQELSHKIKKKRRRAFNLVGRIVFLTQPSKTMTKRFFKFRVSINNLIRSLSLQNKQSRIWQMSNSSNCLRTVTKRCQTSKKTSITNSAQQTISSLKVRKIQEKFFRDQKKPDLGIIKN